MTRLKNSRNKLKHQADQVISDIDIIIQVPFINHSAKETSNLYMLKRRLEDIRKKVEEKSAEIERNTEDASVGGRVPWVVLGGPLNSEKIRPEKQGKNETKS